MTDLSRALILADNIIARRVNEGSLSLFEVAHWALQRLEMGHVNRRAELRTAAKLRAALVANCSETVQ